MGEEEEEVVDNLRQWRYAVAATDENEGRRKEDADAHGEYIVVC